jgi:hypothetical protein
MEEILWVFHKSRVEGLDKDQIFHQFQAAFPKCKHNVTRVTAIGYALNNFSDDPRCVD